jgi:hypothetical protein
MLCYISHQKNADDCSYSYNINVHKANYFIVGIDFFAVGVVVNAIMKPIPIILTTILAQSVMGCAGTIQAMPRDSGQIYKGDVFGYGVGGSITITIKGETYTGPIVATDAGFGLMQKYGKESAIAETSSGSRTVKGLLSSPNNKGLRCEFTSNGLGGSGICVDDEQRIYDAIVNL